MTMIVTIKKGLDINLGGTADITQRVKTVPTSCAITADDYPGITPKVDINVGDDVKVGSVIIHDKTFPDIKVTSPVAGTVSAVVRGERRKLERIVIIPSQQPETSLEFDVADITDRTRAQRLLLDSGLWSSIRQRPYDIIARPGVTPRDIFITGFDSSPLAPDYELMLAGHEAELSAAVKLLAMLTDGNVYLSSRPGSVPEAVEGAQQLSIIGPHPAGNAGVQIAAVKPVNKGDTVWTLNAITLLRIGKLLSTGRLDMSTLVALCGCEVTNPHYVSTIAGADISSIVKDAINDDAINHRIISGNVLTGKPVSADSWLRWPYTQVTVIAEGDDFAEFMGWASLSPTKMSVNRSFPGHWLKRRYCPDARILGGRRAMIMSGVYDKVLPMDILPEYLIKAIMARNIERMEQLGIYEVAAEDFALCEYVDPSKLELQKIVQEGLDYMRNELS